MMRTDRTPLGRLVLAGSACLLLSGCSSFFNQSSNVEVTRSEVEAMHRETQELLSLVRDIESRLDEQSESLASLRADNNSQLSMIEQRLEVLLVQLEEQGGRFERITRTEPRPMPPPVTGTEGGGVVMGNDPIRDPGSAPAGVNDLYEAARRDLLSGKYDLAIAGFQDVLLYYPDSDRADNAQYWIGEANYSQGDMEVAVQEFLKVRDLYPDGDKVCAATLKIGYAFLRTGDQSTARRYFETVMRECPDSDEAHLADEKLKTL